MLRQPSLSVKLSNIYAGVSFFAKFDQFYLNFVNFSISLFVIAQQAVKAWMIENCQFCIAYINACLVPRIFLYECFTLFYVHFAIRTIFSNLAE